jgi:hypothetical protein
MSKQWKHAYSLPPKKAKSQLSSGKMMLNVFSDQWGVIINDYMQKGVTSLTSTTGTF